MLRAKVWGAYVFMHSRCSSIMNSLVPETRVLSMVCAKVWSACVFTKSSSSRNIIPCCGNWGAVQGAHRCKSWGQMTALPGLQGWCSKGVAA